MKIWEFGSEFAWSNDFLMLTTSENLLPQSYELFSTCSAALFAIEKLLKHGAKQRLRLHMPSFYCMKIVAKLKTIFDISWYRDIPGQSSPDFDTLNPAPGDLVLAANIFGIRQGQGWQQWASQHENVILIEDHSHDPFSMWARHSTAHYAVASLRKTLPIPDGGMIWSPQNLPLPKAALPDSAGAYKRLTAMLLKQAYLNGANINKDIYRQLDLASQEELFNETESAVTAFTANILGCLNISEFRRRREANVKHFINCSLAQTTLVWKPLFTSWDPGSVPFNSIIVCQTREIRESLLNYLIHHNIFPPVHWPQPKMGISSEDVLAVDLANRILTIPTDQRYSLNDVDRVFTTIIDFFKSETAPRQQDNVLV